MPMIYTLISTLIEKMNKENDNRKEKEANEIKRKEKEREIEELVSDFNCRLLLFLTIIYIFNSHS